jgi:hypothetical protein
MRKLLLFLTTLLAAIPLAIASPASADGPPPPGGSTPPCVRTIAVSDPSVTEGDPISGPGRPVALFFTVTTSGCVANAAQVEYWALDLSNPLGDYVEANGTLSWAAGNGDPKGIVVYVVPDNSTEFNEGVPLSVSACDGSGVVVSTHSGRGGLGTIIDDDPGQAALPETGPPHDQVCK